MAASCSAISCCHTQHVLSPWQFLRIAFIDVHRLRVDHTAASSSNVYVFRRQKTLCHHLVVRVSRDFNICQLSSLRVDHTISTTTNGVYFLLWQHDYPISIWSWLSSNVPFLCKVTANLSLYGLLCKKEDSLGSWLSSGIFDYVWLWFASTGPVLWKWLSILVFASWKYAVFGGTKFTRSYSVYLSLVSNAPFFCKTYTNLLFYYRMCATVLPFGPLNSLRLQCCSVDRKWCQQPGTWRVGKLSMTWSVCRKDVWSIARVSFAFPVITVIKHQSFPAKSMLQRTFLWIISATRHSVHIINLYHVIGWFSYRQFLWWRSCIARLWWVDHVSNKQQRQYLSVSKDALRSYGVSRYPTHLSNRRIMSAISNGHDYISLSNARHLRFPISWFIDWWKWSFMVFKSASKLAISTIGMDAERMKSNTFRWMVLKELLGYFISFSSIRTTGTVDLFRFHRPTRHWMIVRSFPIMSNPTHTWSPFRYPTSHGRGKYTVPGSSSQLNQLRATTSMALHSPPWIPTPNYWSWAHGSQDRQALCCCKSGNF